MSLGDPFRLLEIGDGAIRAGHQGKAERLCGLLRLDLVAHEPHMLGARADEGDLMLFEDLGEAGVLCKEAVARMHCVGAGDLASRHDLRDVEVAVLRRRSADADAFIGKPHMHGVGVCGRVHRDRGDAELLASTFDAKRNLSPVGDQDLVEHSKKRSALLDDRERLGIFDGLAVVDEDGQHGAGIRGRDVVHGLHGFDDEDGLTSRHTCCQPRRRAGRPAQASDRQCRPWANEPCLGDGAPLCRLARPFRLAAGRHRRRRCLHQP